MKLLAISVFICLSCHFGYAMDLEEAKRWSKKGEDSTASNPELAISYFEKADAFFNSSSPNKSKTYHIYRKAKLFAMIGECEKARYLYDEATNLSIQLNDFEFAIQTYSDKVLRCTFIKGGDLQQALKNALKIKEITKDTDNKRLKILANRTVIDVYWDNPNYQDEVLELSIETHALAQEVKDTSLLKFAIFDLAYSYANIQKYQLALNYYYQIIALQLIADDHSVSASYNNVANIHMELENYDSALYYFDLAKKEAQLENRQDGIGASYLYLGQTYLKIKESELALANCKKALRTFQINQILRRQDLCTQCITQAYEQMGDKANAYEAFKFQLAIEDSLTSVSNINQLDQVRTAFQFELESVQDSLDFEYQHQLSQAKISEQRNRTIFLFIGLGISLLAGGFILNRFRITKKQKRIIEVQQQEVARQHLELIETHKEITDSIAYAKRIQKAILPSAETVQKLLPQSFIYYQPKDVVAGDFYWIDEQDGEVFFAAADCTGHGVPGAMVSVVCNSALNRSLKEYRLSKPGEILDKAREIVINEFAKSGDDVKDGMDIALCKLSNQQLWFAGAHNPLWIIRRNEIIQVKGNKQPIGKFEHSSPFETHHLFLEKDDMIYVFSDGYVDQFGGQNGKKLKSKKMRAIFLEAAQLPINEQKDFIEQAFQNWRGSYEQVDDICVLGVRV